MLPVLRIFADHKQGHGKLIPLPEPYPGSNLFSLASGGAIFIRDPDNYVIDEQLNGGMFSPLTKKDWELILPYLEENERLFGIGIAELLTVAGKRLPPEKVYRKVVPLSVGLAIAAKSDARRAASAPERETVGDTV